MLSKLIFTLFFLLTSTISFSSTEENSVHHVFFVHGLAGDSNTFGDMPNQLIKHLNINERNIEYRSHVFSYETESNLLNTYDFAHELSSYVRDKVAAIGSEDKISFISHSQGGVISAIVLFNSYANKDSYLKEYKDNFKIAVTLGTPFWGSKLADIITYPQDFLERYVSNNKEEYFARAGKLQLREMSLFSNTIRKFRKSLLNMKPEFAKKLFSQIDVLNIGGVANISRLTKKYNFSYQPTGLSKYLKFVFGGQYEYEADIAVSLPSSRLDAIYINDIKSHYRNNRITAGNKTVDMSYTKFIPVYGIHASPDANDFLDIAFLPQGICRTIDNCKHPTYELIYKHFTGLSTEGVKSIVDKDRLSGFVVNFEIELPRIFKFKLGKIKVERIETSTRETFPGASIKGVDIKFDKLFEKRSNSSHIEKNKRNMHFTGAFHFKDGRSIVKKAVTRMNKEYLHKNGAILTFRIKLRGFKTRYVKALVRPMKSTFIKLNLEPFY